MMLWINKEQNNNKKATDEAKPHELEAIPPW